LTKGNYREVLELTRHREADPTAAALHIRALANLEPAAADRACAEAAMRHPFSTELQFLRAALLVELEQDEAAEQAARRVIYLDRSLAVGHFTLGSICWRRGDLAGARRAFRNAHQLCAARPADEMVPLSDGERAGRLAEAAAAQLAILETVQEASR